MNEAPGCAELRALLIGPHGQSVQTLASAIRGPDHAKTDVEPERIKVLAKFHTTARIRGALGLTRLNACVTTRQVGPVWISPEVEQCGGHFRGHCIQAAALLGLTVVRRWSSDGECHACKATIVKGSWVLTTYDNCDLLYSITKTIVDLCEKCAEELHPDDMLWIRENSLKS